MKEIEKELIDEVKGLCRRLGETLGESAHYHYIFNGKINLGVVMDAAQHGIGEGVKNNIIGEPSKIANLMYAVSLVYIKQIQKVMDFTDEQLLNAFISRLINDYVKLANVEPVMGYKVKNMATGGNA